MLRHEKKKNLLAVIENILQLKKKKTDLSSAQWDAILNVQGQMMSVGKFVSECVSGLLQNSNNYFISTQ